MRVGSCAHSFSFLFVAPSCSGSHDLLHAIARRYTSLVCYDHGCVQCNVTPTVATRGKIIFEFAPQAPQARLQSFMLSCDCQRTLAFKASSSLELESESPSEEEYASSVTVSCSFCKTHDSHICYIWAALLTAKIP